MKNNELIGKPIGKKKCHYLKNVWEILRRIAPKLKNIFFPLWLPSITTLKIETSWAKKIVKSILETRNANDVIVKFILSSNKKIKNMQCKKE